MAVTSEEGEMGFNGMEWDGMGWDGMGWDGTVYNEFFEGACFLCPSAVTIAMTILYSCIFFSHTGTCEVNVAPKPTLPPTTVIPKAPPNVDLSFLKEIAVKVRAET